MCGICGIFRYDGEPPDEAVLSSMTSHLRHRGNDARGVRIVGGAGLGHQRLSIIDLSEKANQPLSSGDGRYWMVYNGEVYNFLSLRREMEARVSFTSTSDTEVVLYSWIEKGMDSLSRFNGMFAFAIWDSLEKKLVLARDRAGVKPLYYSDTGKELVFASEIKSILLHPRVTRGINGRALSDYLSLGYIPGEETIFTSIRKLPPGHVAVVDPSGHLSLSRWWDLRDHFISAQKEDLEEKILQLLEAAVRDRLVSDVDVGFFLSGGIDSSSILYYARKFKKDALAFSLGFREKSYDELPFAGKFSRDMNTVLRSTVFTAPDREFLRELTWYYDQPFADTSNVPTFQLCRFASSEVKVVLSGDGGDELFGGYETYRADLLADLGRRFFPFWSSILRAAQRLMMPLPANLTKVSTDYKIRQFARYACLPAAEAHCCWRLLFDEQDKGRLLHRDIFTALDGYRTHDMLCGILNKAKDFDLYRQVMYVDFVTWLPDDILLKVDTASMANTLEVRSPFLDFRLVELAAAIPGAKKVDLLTTKKILKKALKGVVPDTIRTRKKAGFSSPVSTWLLGELKPLFMDVIQGDAFRAFFPDTPSIMKFYDELERKERDRGFALWTLFMFGLWAENYLT